MAVLAVAVGGAMLASGAASVAGIAATATFAGMTAVQWGFMAGSMVGNMLFTDNPNGPRIEDKKVQGQGYGAPIWEGWGTIRGAGQLIWSGDLIEHENHHGKGKRGGNTYSYSVDCAVAICEGEINDVLRIWANGILIYDANGTTTFDTEVISGTGLTVYKGTEDQPPSAMIEGYLGAGVVPAYRGTAYVTFEGLLLEKFGNRVPSFEFEVANGALTTSSITARSLRAKNVNDGSGYFCRIHDGWLIGSTTNNLYRYDFDGVLVNTYTLPHAANKKIITDAVALEGGSISYAWTYGDGGYLTWIDLFNDNVKSISRPEFGNVTDLIMSNAQGAFCRFLNGTDYCVYTAYVDINNQYPTLGPKVYNMGNVNKVFIDHLGMAYGTKDNGTGASFFWRSSGPSIFDRTIISSADVNAGGILDVAVDPATNYIILPVFNASQAENSGVYLFDFNIVRTGFIRMDPVINKGLRLFTDGVDWYVACTEIGNTSRPIVVQFNASRMEVVRTYNFDTSDPPATWGFSPQCLEPRTNGLYMTSTLSDPSGVLGTDGYISGKMSLNFWTPGSGVIGAPADLSDIVSEIMTRSGLNGSVDFDVSALAGNVVRGYMRGRTMSARAALEPLQAAWYFDMPEIDWQLKAVVRGGASEISIPQDDLLVTDGSYGPTIDLTRQQDLDLPKQITVSFKDIAANYEAGTQDARREATSATGKASIELPIVFNASEAKQRALATLSMIWMARDQVKLSVSTKYLRLNPASPITVEMQDGSDRRIVIKSMTAGKQTIEIDALFDDVANYYQDDATGADRETLPPPDPIASVSPSGLILLDVPLLQDSDDVATPVQYWASYPIAPTERWSGSVLFKSADGGINYANLATTTAKPTWGYAKNVMAAFYGGDIFDEETVIDVELSYGTLAPASQLSVLNGSNLAVIGKEVFQFKNATLVSGTTWRLSGLLRGRRNSEYAIFTHGILEKFLLLTGVGVGEFTVPLSDVNNARLYKPVTSSQPIADAQAQTFTTKGMTLRPVSPVFIESEDIGGDLSITWTRRTRVGGSWADYIDVPLSETSEAYEIDIWDAGFTTRKRVLTSSTTVVTYTSADITTDFGSMPAQFGVRVYQMSDKVGRGCPGKAVLPGGMTIPEEPDNSSMAQPPS
jgi:hypothetical protein